MTLQRVPSGLLVRSVKSPSLTKNTAESYTYISESAYLEVKNQAVELRVYVVAEEIRVVFKLGLATLFVEPSPDRKVWLTRWRGEIRSGHRLCRGGHVLHLTPVVSMSARIFGV